MSHPDLLFVSYQDSLDLLSVDDAMRICEDVYRMLARDTVAHSRPPSFKLDIAEDFNNHWHAKAALLRLCDGMCGMSRQAGIKYFRDGGMLREKFRDAPCILFVLPHANVQRLDTAQHQPAIERAGRRAEGVRKILKPVAKL